MCKVQYNQGFCNVYKYLQESFPKDPHRGRRLRRLVGKKKKMSTSEQGSVCHYIPFQDQFQEFNDRRTLDETVITWNTKPHQGGLECNLYK